MRYICCRSIFIQSEYDIYAADRYLFNLNIVKFKFVRKKLSVKISEFLQSGGLKTRSNYINHILAAKVAENMQI